MKTNKLTLAGLLVSSVAMAGEPAMTTPMQTAVAPSLGDWFVGGTYTDLESDADLYAIQIGRDLDSKFMGFDTAIYLEAGAYEGDRYTDGEPATLEYNPFTINVKLERPLVGPLNCYITGGVGFAIWDLSVQNGAPDYDGTSFYAQTSAGLLYNVCANFEVFAGGRLVYLDEESESEVGWEVGGRINF